MSWSVNYSGLTAGEVHAKLLGESAYIPQQIKSYIVAGVTAVAVAYGDDVKVDVEGYGHLSDGSKDDDKVTSASLGIRKSVAETGEDGKRGDDPTVDQWVAAGYRAENYHFTVSTPEEIAAAVKAEQDRDAERDRLAQETDKANREQAEREQVEKDRIAADKKAADDLAAAEAAAKPKD